MEKIIEITGREFRANQKTYLDLSDKGARIVIRRGQNKSYVITPVINDDDYQRYFTPELLARIDKSLQQAKEGKIIKTKSKDELIYFLDSL
ncbi:MAG: prevent-host-death protein [Prevotellaceae bacterium]|nr:prevent-host-death protein [Prevotellaceae bacterium]